MAETQGATLAKEFDGRVKGGGKKRREVFPLAVPKEGKEVVWLGKLAEISPNAENSEKARTRKRYEGRIK